MLSFHFVILCLLDLLFLLLSRTICGKLKGVMYSKKYSCSPDLQPYVKKFWTKEKEAFEDVGTTYRFTPDGYVEFLFYLHERAVYHFPMHQDGMEYEALVIGQFTRHVDFTLPANMKALMVKIYPWATAAFFGVPASEMTDRVVNLYDLFPQEKSFIQNEVLGAGNIYQAIYKVEQFLRRIIRPERLDKHLSGLIKFVFEQQGMLKMEELLDLSNHSQRHLNTLFRQSLGLSPKFFSGVRRIYSVAHAIRSNPNKPLTEICYEFDYFDQAHFIRDFKKFTFNTPSQVKKRIRPIGALLNLRVR